MRGHAFLLAIIASLVFFVSGCSDNEDFVLTNTGGGSGTQTATQEQESVFSAFEQDSVTQLLGRTVELAALATPGPVVSPQSTTITRGAALEPGAIIPVAGDFELRSSTFQNRIRIDIFNPRNGERVARADLLPATTPRTDGRPGFDQEIILGPDRFNEVNNYSGGRIEKTIYEQLFFGYTGRALLKYDALGRLEELTYQNVLVPGRRDWVVESTRAPFLRINGTLQRSGDELNGTLQYGNPGEFPNGSTGRFTVKELISVTGTHQNLLLASELFGGQGRAFLSANFDASGVYSPIPDPSLSSPLVNVPVASPEFPIPVIDVPLTTSLGVNYTVKDGVFQAILPSGEVQGANIYALETFTGLAPGAVVPIPNDATLQMFASPGGTLIAGSKAQVYVFAVGANGRAVPFSIRSFALSSADRNIVRVSSATSNQVEALAPGTTGLVFRDQASGKSAFLALTVAGSTQDVNGFAYLSDFQLQRIVRFDFNTATGSPGAPVFFDTGHSPFQLLVSADQNRLFAENSDGTLQIFSIDAFTGELTELTEQALAVRGLSQSQLQPNLYYGNLGGDMVEFELTNNEELVVVRTLAGTNSGSLVTALVGGNQMVYGSFQSQIFSIDAASTTGEPDVVTMETGAFVTNMAVTRLDANGPQFLEVLVRRQLQGGGFDSVLRSFELNSDGTLNTPGSRQINVDPDARELAVLGNRAYNGSFDASTINGTQLAPTALTALPGSPYQAFGPPTALAITGLNNQLLLSATGTTLEVFRIATDGSLTSAGHVEAGNGVTDLQVVLR